MRRSATGLIGIWMLLAAGCGGGGGGKEDADADGDVPVETEGADVPDGEQDVVPDLPPDAPDLPDGTDPVPDAPDITETVEPDMVIECDGDCHYVREAASGDGSGSDWDNAMTALPDNLERGHVYYVAAGSYPGVTFDDPASGTEVIAVVKATAGDHGTETGWSAAYGEGRAVFGPVAFDAPTYVFDGRGGRGFEVVGEFEGTALTIGADDVWVGNVDVNAAFAADGGGSHVDGSCTGMDIGGSNVTVTGCEIHDAADDGVSIGGLTNLTFSGNIVHRLHGCGTDGGCGPCYNGHSDGLELYNVKDSTFDGNMIYDIASTACIFFGNWADELGGGPSEYCGNVTLVNNILYSPDTGFVAYIQDVDVVKAYHNVFWGIRQGRYGGLSLGEHITDMDLYNNVILSINTEHIGVTYDPANHRHDYNLIGVSLGQVPDGPNDVVNGDPGFTGIPDMDGAAVDDPLPEAFSLEEGSPCIDQGFPGDASIVIPPLDFFGTARDALPDLGAVEHH
jgi:hypothetical protein